MRLARAISAFAALFVASAVHAADCAAPPLRDSQQAMCYALAYAEKHGLSHGGAFKRNVAKGQNVWTVRFLDDDERAQERGWEIDIDGKSGKIARFTSYRPISRRPQ